jgi:hypothetical protein
MTNNEIKARTFELIDSRREEMISFLRDYIQHRSINPEREISEVEGGGPPLVRNGYSKLSNQ